VNTVWIVVGLGVAAALIALIPSWQRRDEPADPGAVSHRWIAEHRLEPDHDPRS
jgi:hypothetical protein